MEKNEAVEESAEHTARGRDAAPARLRGPRCEIGFGQDGYPEALMRTPDPPERLYIVGDPHALQEGLAVIGARKATPYGISAASKFSALAAERGISIVSGGALGCDAAAHRGALAVGGRTVAVLGGGCDRLYPAANADLFQRIVDEGGAVVSEHEWGFPPMRHAFRARNRIIAGLARATLIVEAGLPSGTFSTADDALAANRDVLVVPGAITSPTSRGANRLLYQGAMPVIDEESFEDALCALFGLLRMQDARDLLAPERVGSIGARAAGDSSDERDELLSALCAEPMRLEQMLAMPCVKANAAPCEAGKALSWLMMRLAVYERDGLVTRFPDGRYGPARV